MRRAILAVVMGALVGMAGPLQANPIPLPVPASMPLEEMRVAIDRSGHAQFSGDFTFDFIPADVTQMAFPLPPVNAAGVRLLRDGTPLPWVMSTDTYPTVLAEHPALPMVEWAGPFPEEGAVFTVEYEHDLFRRDGDRVFFYSLGTGKYFRTYDKITTAILDIDLPGPDALKSVLLDDVVLDPSFYTLTDSHLQIVLESEFGPFTRDLILLLIPEPGALMLIAVGLLALAGVSLQRGRPRASADPRARGGAGPVGEDGRGGRRLSREKGRVAG